MLFTAQVLGNAQKMGTWNQISDLSYHLSGEETVGAQEAWEGRKERLVRAVGRAVPAEIYN